MTTRQQIVAVARGFLGTRYLHLGRLPGVALDCAGVIICAGRITGSMTPDFDVEPYPLASEGHILTGYCDAALGGQVDMTAMQPGDVVVVWTDVRAQHMGIVGDYRYGGPSIIHAMARRISGIGRVIETRLTLDKFAAAYKFPGIDP